MAESMQGLHRSHRCTEVSNKNIGETVTVMGWVQKKRNLGSLIFRRFKRPFRSSSACI